MKAGKRPRSVAPFLKTLRIPNSTHVLLAWRSDAAAELGKSPHDVLAKRSLQELVKSSPPTALL